MDNTYGCDLCAERIPYDEVHWLTSSFGLCIDCYSRLSKEERDALRIYSELDNGALLDKTIRLICLKQDIEKDIHNDLVKIREEGAIYD